MNSLANRFERPVAPITEQAVAHDDTCAPQELASMLAEALGAKRCIVSMPVDEGVAEVCANRIASFGEIHPSPKTAIVEYSDARDRMFSVLSLQGKVIGFVQVSGLRDRPPFTGHDLNVLRIVSVLITKAIEADRLKQLLASPFVQRALQQPSDPLIGAVVAQSMQNPGQVSKMLARSFYREMTRAGFDSGEIIGAATEIISELAENVRKHSDRKQRSAGPALAEQARH
ncbi:hypothetical protein ACQKRQ_26840 [Paraburkholderia sp. NPDC080076]|uniref:hypothetical protein n=1 Tax=Paraburkholderia sp. NPDC080076 TaxID=3390605 RepID=UPI003D04EECA